MPDCTGRRARCRPPADAAVFLRGGSATTHYLLYLPSNATGDGANFTLLAPPVGERGQGLCPPRGIPHAPAAHVTAPSCRMLRRSAQWAHSPRFHGCPSHGCLSSPGRPHTCQVQDWRFLVRDWHSSGDGSGEGSEEGSADSGGSSFLYAVVSSAAQRNGQLVMTRLGPGAMAGAAAGEAGSVPAPAPAPGLPEGGGPDDGSSGGTGSASSWVVLQAHSREVEIVDLTVSSSHLALLERRNGTLVATAYPLPTDGARRRCRGHHRRLPPLRRCGWRLALRTALRPVSACGGPAGSTHNLAALRAACHFVSCPAASLSKPPLCLLPSPYSRLSQARRCGSCPRASSSPLRRPPTPYGWATRAPLTARCCGCGTAASRSRSAPMTSTCGQARRLGVPRHALALAPGGRACEQAPCSCSAQHMRHHSSSFANTTRRRPPQCCPCDALLRRARRPLPACQPSCLPASHLPPRRQPRAEAAAGGAGV